VDSTPLPEHETLDAIGTADVQVLQARRGYRFGLDAVLLAAFAARVHPGGPLLELGAGSGVVSLLLVKQFGVAPVTALELQPGLHARLVRNVALNGCADRLTAVQGDWRALSGATPGAPFAHVVANPPYYAPAAGRVSPEEERRLARHEVNGDFASLALAARRLLRPDGVLTVVHLASRLGEVLPLLAGHGFAAQQLRLVHPRVDAPAKLLLVSARKGGGADLTVLPPLVVHGDGPDGYGPEVAQWMASPGRVPT
jgi:tRNA1Val (adenine37-N6)-methyltransferase